MSFLLNLTILLFDVLLQLLSLCLEPRWWVPVEDIFFLGSMLDLLSDWFLLQVAQLEVAEFWDLLQPVCSSRLAWSIC